MLVDLNDILYPARLNHYGIGEFAVTDVAMAKLVVDTAAACDMPVILGVSENMLGGVALSEIAESIYGIAKAAFVPVVLHYSSGHSVDECIRAMKLGFTSVKLDLSDKPLEENISEVKTLCRFARAYGVTVEGQVGIVPKASDTTFEDIKKGYTNVDDAVRFVNESDVDVLSISAGNATGHYGYKPMLDVNRIITLADKIKIPLSMDGISGLHEFDVLHAVGNGVAKISCFTDISDAAVSAIAAFLGTDACITPDKSSAKAGNADNANTAEECKTGSTSESGKTACENGILSLREAAYSAVKDAITEKIVLYQNR